MIVTFTGPHKLKNRASTREIITQALSELGDPDELRSGAAPGVDTIAFYASFARWGATAQHVFVPAGLMYNQDLVSLAKSEGCEITRVEGGYLKRDDAMVKGADLLIAFPNSMREELRSGTWATIRRAWKRGVPVRYLPLDGKRGPVIRCT